MLEFILYGCKCIVNLRWDVVKFLDELESFVAYLKCFVDFSLSNTFMIFFKCFYCCNGHCSGNKWILNTLYGKCFIYAHHQKLCKFSLKYCLQFLMLLYYYKLNLLQCIFRLYISFVSILRINLKFKSVKMRLVSKISNKKFVSILRIKWLI